MHTCMWLRECMLISIKIDIHLHLTRTDLLPVAPFTNMA